MPEKAERQIKQQGGTARYRTVKSGDKTMTCAVTRKEGPKGGRTVCWPKHESLSSGAERVKALFHAPSLSEGAHKAGCACGWCKNKGNIGKKKTSTEEPEVPKEVAEGRDDIGKLGLGKAAVRYARMTTKDAMSGKKPQMFMDMTAEVTNQKDRQKGFGIQDKGEDTSGKKLSKPKLKESAAQKVERLLA